jgi:hypothetical protein
VKDIEGIDAVLEVLKPHWAEITADFDRRNERFLELSRVDHQAIGRVLRVHLVVENFMNSFLPDYFGLEEFDGLRLSFYQKAILLPAAKSSASFVRPGILQINAVRNKFAHRLNHVIQNHEISAIYEALAVARDGVDFEPLEAIEAFAPVACAFLSLPPKHLQGLFFKAFANLQSFTPEQAAHPTA